MIGRDADMRCAAVHEREDGGHDAADGAHLASLRVERFGNGVVMPKEFVRSVDQMDAQGG